MTSATHSPPSPIAGEIRALTGLRIVAALWVVSFHFSFTPGDTYTWLWAPLRPIVQTGALGVDLFYVLSGFVITLTYLEKMGRHPFSRVTVGFWWARICRIWPVYATVTTLFGAWMIYKSTRVTDGFIVWQTVQPKVDVWHYLMQLAMVQLWTKPTFDGSSWVGPAWSISAEWLAYVAFPIVVLLLWRLRRAPAAVTAALALGCMLPFAYACYESGNPYFPWSWALRIGAGFLAGSLTCLAVRRMRVTPQLDVVAGAVAVLAVVAVLGGLWWGSWRGHGGGEYGGVVVVAFPVLVGALALSRRGLSRVLSTRPMVHGGRISFSLYLVHVPIFEIFWTMMQWHGRMGPGTVLGETMVPLVLLFALVVAHLSYRYLEEAGRLWLRPRGPGRWSHRGSGADRTVGAVPRPRESEPQMVERTSTRPELAARS